VYHAMRITWKCVWSLTDSRWPRCLCDAQAATQFFDLLLFSQERIGALIAAVDVDAVGRGGESEVSCVPLQHVAAWRLAKWLGKISSRCISTLGIAPRVTEKRARAAANLLHDRYVAPLTQHALALVKWHDNGVTMINSKAFILALECLELAVSHQAAYVGHLLPAAEQLLTSLLFRRLRFSSEDEEMWTTNPEEYVRKLTDPRGDLFNAKLISMGLVVTLCHARKPYHSQELLMSFITFLLTKLAALSQAVVQGSAEFVGPEYDGCLYAIGQMKKLFAHDHQVDDAKIEWLLLTYVTPLLSCPVGYLRAKSVYVLSLFKDTAWSSPTTYSSILQAVIPLLKDAELPVRIQTCVCLSRFIRTDAAREVITPQIGAVVEQYFQIMRQMDNDGVVRTLRKTVSFYGDALSVWATDLCRMLVQHFLTVHAQLASKHKDIDADMGDEEDEMVDSLLAADELMETLRTLVQAVPREESARATMHSMQETLAPLLQMIMSVRQGANLGFMDAALHLLTTVISRSLAIAPSFWSIASLLFTVGLDTSFLDYVEHLVAPIDNFLTVDPIGFLDCICCTAPDGAQASCGEMVVHLCRGIVANGTSFHHLSTAPKLVDAVLLHTWACGSTTPKSQWVCSQLLQQSLGVLSSRASSMPQTLQALFADNILVGLFTAPTIALPLLENTGAPQFIMESIIGLLQAGAVRPSLRLFDRKVVMMSFASLMDASPLSATAQVLASSIANSPILGQLATEDARLMTNEVAYHQKRLSGKLDDSDDEHDEAWDDSSDDDDDTDMTGSDLDDMDDEDVGSDVSDDGDIRNEAQFSTVLAQANKLRGASLGEDFDDGEENFLDDNDFETPLDDLNVWRAVGEAAARVPAVLVDTNTIAAVEEASRLFEKCVELRNSKHNNV
jgi:importin-7